MIISERVRGRMVVSDLTSLAFFSVSRVQGEGRWAAQEEPVSSISCTLHIVVVQRSLHVAIALINLYGWLPWKYIVAIGTDYFVAINIALFSGPTQLSVTCLSIVQKEGRLWREEGGGGVIGSEACHYNYLVIPHCTQSQVFGLFYLLCQKWECDVCRAHRSLLCCCIDYICSLPSLSHSGFLPAECDKKFLDLACRLDRYGMDFHPVRVSAGPSH